MEENDSSSVLLSSSDSAEMRPRTMSAPDDTSPPNGKNGDEH